MQSLRELVDTHQGRLLDKWGHYLDIYERHFAKFRNTACRILEIGVSHGGSLQLWKAYFGPKARIVGLDIDPRCLDYEETQIQIYHGDQGDRPFMGAFEETTGPFDIVIDDGSHIDVHQAASFKKLWPKMPPGAVYLIEDCHEHYPYLDPIPQLVYRYPWVMVCERPKRIVKGTPSRSLNDDEKRAYALYLDPNLQPLPVP